MTIERLAARRRYAALVELLRTANTLWDASRAFFGRWNLSPSQFNLLNLLEGCSPGVTQTELSRQLIVHRSGVTGLVDRLERRGLVARRNMEGDRRAYRVVLTHAGARLMGAVLPLYSAAAERACQGLSEKRAADMVTDLRRIAQNAQRIGAEQRRAPRPSA
jgi:DNA-binding MarR family transcriptional regulator